MRQLHVREQQVVGQPIEDERHRLVRSTRPDAGTGSRTEAAAGGGWRKTSNTMTSPATAAARTATKRIRIGAESAIRHGETGGRSTAISRPDDPTVSQTLAGSIRSTTSARQAGASNGLAKYSVIFATFPSRTSPIPI